jgi:hypothetical protein
MLELDGVPPKRPLLLTLVVMPEEVELAFATGGESLKKRLLIALVAEMTLLSVDEHKVSLLADE